MMNISPPSLFKHKTMIIACFMTLLQISYASAQGVDGGAPSVTLPVREDVNVGQQYVKNVFGDWAVVCRKEQDAAADGCYLSHVMLNGQGTPGGEITIFNARDPAQQDKVIPVITIATPLETYLRDGVTLSLENLEDKTYSYEFCDKSGCYIRLPLTQDQVDAFQAGEEAGVSITPILAKDRRLRLKVSLIGFTKAYNDLP